MAADVLPRDLDAEHALLGALLVGFPEAITYASSRLTAADFSVSSGGRVFDEIVRAHRAGERADAVTVHSATGVPLVDLRAWEGCSSAAWKRTADVVAATAVRRSVIHASNEVSTLAREVSDAGEVLDFARSRFSSIELPAVSVPRDFFDADELLSRTDATPKRWVIPGLIRAGWRIVLVAFEGLGKSVVLNSLAVALSHGYNAFTGRTCEPKPVLMIDLENPVDVLAPRIRQVAEAAGNQRQAPLKVWHREAGLNLRKRADRAELDAILRQTRPELVTLGPLYKAYRPEGRERDEEAAAEAQAVLDDFRSRYGFALLMEHHAPHAEAGSKRKPRPFGSSLWLRWPEMGLSLELPDDPKLARNKSLTVGRWRGDRVQAPWPDRLDRGGKFPWTGYWSEQLPEVV